MFFAKDEVIELSDKKYLVLNVTILENEVYYQIQEIDQYNNIVIGDKRIVTGSTEGGSLYIVDVSDETILNNLISIFKS